MFREDQRRLYRIIDSKRRGEGKISDKKRNLCGFWQAYGNMNVWFACSFIATTDVMFRKAWEN